MLDHMRDIGRADGIAGFWKGVSTTTVRAVILGAQHSRRAQTECAYKRSCCT